MKKSEILYLLSEYFQYQADEYHLTYEDKHITITFGRTVFNITTEFKNGMWFSCYEYDNDGALAIINHLLKERKYHERSKLSGEEVN